MVVRVIVHPLAADSEVLPARQIILPFIVAHSNLVPSLEEVVVWLVDEDVEGLEVSVELHLEAVLVEHRVTVALVVRVGDRRTCLPTIRPVSLNHGQSCPVDEVEHNSM